MSADGWPKFGSESAAPLRFFGEDAQLPAETMSRDRFFGVGLLGESDDRAQAPEFAAQSRPLGGPHLIDIPADWPGLFTGGASPFGSVEALRRELEDLIAAGHG